MPTLRRLHPNLATLRDLPAEFARPSTRPERVAIGWGADPYGPRERVARLMPRLLTMLADFAIPTILRTRSPLIVRDIEPLAHLTRTAGLRVAFRIATLEDVRVAAHLARAGIHVDLALLHALGATLEAELARVRIEPEAPRQLRLNIAV